MNLDDIRRTYEGSTSKASEISRQLGFAGIAVVWLLSGAGVDPTGRLSLAPSLLVPGFFLVAALGLDLLHAVYRAAAWGAYGRYLELRGATEDVDAPRWVNYPSLGLFWAKLAGTMTAYVLLGVHLVQRL